MDLKMARGATRFSLPHACSTTISRKSPNKRTFGPAHLCLWEPRKRDGKLYELATSTTQVFALNNEVREPPHE